MDIKATLTKRVGPLPVYAWVGVGVGGVFVGRFLMRRSAGDVPSANLAATGDYAETGYGESAIPYDITGRDPSVDVPPVAGYDDAGGGTLPVTPPIQEGNGSTGSGSVPATPAGYAGITPRFGIYGAQGKRDCPPGYHLVRDVLAPLRGRCVPNTGSGDANIGRTIPGRPNLAGV